MGLNILSSSLIGITFYQVKEREDLYILRSHFIDSIYVRMVSVTRSPSG